MDPTKIDLDEFLATLPPPIPDDPMTRNLRLMADHWRRMAGEVANAVSDPDTQALYFNRFGMVVGVRSGDQDYANGRPVSEPPGVRIWCSRNGAADLDNHARWAEHVWAARMGNNEHPRPEGEMPRRIAQGVSDAKRNADHVKARAAGGDAQGASA